MASRTWSRRGLSWSGALDRMKGDRMDRQPIREERLQVKPGALGLTLSAWRGQSGKRYVVSVHALAVAAHRPDVDVVMIAVRRGADGIAHLVGCGHRGTIAEAVEFARADRATEIHVHQLADTAETRDAIIEDLVGDDAI